MNRQAQTPTTGAQIVIHSKKQAVVDATRARAGSNPFDQVRDAAAKQRNMPSMKALCPQATKADDVPHS